VGKLNSDIVEHGPAREDGLPAWVTWRGQRFDTPDYEFIREMVYDSVVSSLYDYDVEPDGHDPEGSPSWLLAIGLM